MLQLLRHLLPQVKVALEECLKSSGKVRETTPVRRSRRSRRVEEEEDFSGVC